jgi:hypothetical protein
MYNFAQKTQSIWFLAYFSAIFLALVTLLGIFNVLTLDSITPDKGLLYSGLLFSIGAGFGLGSLESSERGLFWKWKLFHLLLILIGLVLALSGVSASFSDPQVIFGVNWDLLIIIGIPFLVYGTILFFSGMSEATKESFAKLWPIFGLLLLISLIIGFLGFSLFFLTEGGRNDPYPISWDVSTSIAVIFGILSIIPFGYLIGAKESEKEKFHKMWIIWLIFAIAGLTIFLLTLVEVFADIDIVGGSAHREGGLILGLVFQAPGFVFLLSSTNKNDLIKKLSLLYPLLLIVGLVIAFTSEFVPSLKVSTLGSGFVLVIIASGLIYKSISLEYVPTSSTSAPTSVRSTSSAPVSGKSVFEIPNELPVEEKIFVIEMQRKTNENTIQLLTNAAKQNRLSKSYVDRKIQELKSINSQTESQIATIREQAKVRSRQSIFDNATKAIGTDSQPTQQVQSAPIPVKSPSPPPMATMKTPQPTMSPPGPPSSPPPPMSPPTPKTQSSGPPMPPPPVSSGPPMPPSGTPPMPMGAPPMPPGVSSSGPPKPPGMPPMPSGAPPMPPGVSSSGPPKPPGMPPMPPGSAPPMPPSGANPPMPGASQQPKPPGAPSGDAVGTARSTSIAELRGEMLKELRRLRDIFNEDGK